MTGEQLQYIREEINMNRKQFGTIWNLSDECIRLYETGKQPIPRAIASSARYILQQRRKHDDIIAIKGLDVIAPYIPMLLEAIDSQIHAILAEDEVREGECRKIA